MGLRVLEAFVWWTRNSDGCRGGTKARAKRPRERNGYERHFPFSRPLRTGLTSAAPTGLDACAANTNATCGGIFVRRIIRSRVPICASGWQFFTRRRVGMVGFVKFTQN